MQVLMSSIDLKAMSPELMVIITAILAIILDLIISEKRYVAYLSIIGILFSMVLCARLWGQSIQAFNNLLSVDNYSLFFNFIFLISALLTLAISVRYVEEQQSDHGEYYVLVLLATFGAMLMAAAKDLIIIFLGLELMSLSLYILAGFRRHRLDSSEAALKYFLLGAFASGFFLYGIALIYGVCGSTNLTGIADFISRGSPGSPPLTLLIGIGLLMVGFGFKVAIVPFHQWVPDVYEGAPTPISAFIAGGPKAAGFAALLRVLISALEKLQFDLTYVLWVLAVLTMTLGNVVAISQLNIKRMLAYSSVAHAGYVLVGIVGITAGSSSGAQSALLYLLIYTIMNTGAFAVAILMSRREDEKLLISDYAGVGFKRPLLGLTMAIFMFSLAGFPPTAGFVGKFYIFSAALKANLTWLVIIGVLNSALSAFYYLRVVVIMYMKEPTEDFNRLASSPLLSLALIISILGVIGIGILPSYFFKLAEASIGAILM